jgi:hypothetical protein
VRLIIECEFDNGPQTLIKENATAEDAERVGAAMNGDPGDVIQVTCRLTPTGPDRPRLIRAGAIRSVTERQIVPCKEI